MAESTNRKSGITRRGFLKTTGAMAAAGVIGAAGADRLTALAAGTGQDDAGTKVVINNCRSNCGGRCPVRVTVREGKVVKTAPSKMTPGNEDQARICVKGLSQPQRLYDPDRLKYPMKRAEGTERGDEQWERISWDEAFKTIGDKFNELIKTDGGSSIAMWTGYASQGILNGSDQHGWQSIGYGRFSKAIGTSSFDSAADWAGILGGMQTGLYSQGNTQNVIGTKNIILIGADPTEPMQFEWVYIKKAMEQGARLITIDPRFSNAAAHSDVYLPIIPGTDGLLLLAWCNYVLENCELNMDFLTKGSVAPVLVKEDGTFLHMSDLGVEPQMVLDPTYGIEVPVDPLAVWDESTNGPAPMSAAVAPAIFGEFVVNGVPMKTALQISKEAIAGYTMERAAEECGLDLATITDVIEHYAAEPSCIISYNGMAHHNNSHYNYKPLALLVALTGNHGRQGAVCLAGGTWTYYWGVNSADATPPNAKEVIRYPGMLLPKLLEEGHLGDHVYRPKAIWVMNGNPLANESGRCDLVDAFKQMELIVVSDSVMTDTARYADIILPIVHPYEETDILNESSAGSHGHYVPLCKAVEPAFECRTDMDCFRGVAAAMGMPDLYDKTDDEYLEEAFTNAPTQQMIGLTKDALFEAGFRGEVFATPIPLLFNEKQSYVTATGPNKLIEFYWEKPTPRYDYGQEIDVELERVPGWAPPHEASASNPLFAKYPLLPVNNHSRYSTHSQQAHTLLIRELQPEPVVKLNPEDAAARGIETGDIVRVFNDRGYVVIKAELTEGIRPGTINMRQGWQSDHFIEGHAQDLTDIYMNEYCQNSNFVDYLCEVELWS